ncbi:TetR/AcrR family transcriptional regulator [Mycobacterium sp. 852002-51163_SCH5372311]|uniref:TetR/AcrR family transcriptional regulator n=1 Tax=Mycobacterium sp. 852002-51163_SCH5372311 TaxID=1834097 RepID=UPI0018D38E9A|nr:TetR/AcrR family transcriptional regulator [Mycobacterium sp. 852002-51163_SCH5372311]
MDTKKRNYEMRARQEAAAATRSAIVEAAVDSVMAERSLAVTLGTVADRAGVTVKTVLRHFGSREALIDEAASRAMQDVLLERLAPPDDPEHALAVLIAHYERRGEPMLGILAEEVDDPRARQICDAGRTLHRTWVEEVFGVNLPPDPVERSRLVDTLVVATDVYTWKLLRRDRGLTVDGVRDRMLLIARAVLAAPVGSVVEGAGR